MSTTHPQTRGFTIIESVVAMLIVTGILVAAIRAVASTNAVRFAARERVFAATLAEDILLEACSKSYEDASAGGIIGTDGSDTSFFPRAMDDVDDYEQLQEIPPTTPDGTTIPGAGGWKRVTRVEYVDPADPSATVASDQGVKRVSVSVYKGTRKVLTLAALRTRAWDGARK